MPTTVTATPAVPTASARRLGLADPVPKPPGRAPGEPIIIKVPPRPPQAPEVDAPRDEQDEEAEIRLPGTIVPELPPPPAPWERMD